MAPCGLCIRSGILFATPVFSEPRQASSLKADGCNLVIDSFHSPADPETPRVARMRAPSLDLALSAADKVLDTSIVPNRWRGRVSLRGCDDGGKEGLWFRDE